MKYLSVLFLMFVLVSEGVYAKTNKLAKQEVE